MILLIDYGNTRIKWRLIAPSGLCREGFCVSTEPSSLQELAELGPSVSRVAVSMVGSESAMALLESVIREITPAPIRFYWAEQQRDGLTNAYADVNRMGADRWHAMLGAWAAVRAGVAVIDAGSALTVDYIDRQGRHLGGYILPGLQMMRQSLQIGAARVGFDDEQQLSTLPGRSTSECVNHGLAWLGAGLVDRIQRDAHHYRLQRLLVTGGDAQRLLALGLDGEHHPDLVFEGLTLVDQAEAHQ